MKVVWDETKNAANLKNHGISFKEASALFTRRVGYFEIFDEQHSVEEDRFIAIGPIQRGLVLVVYAEREEDTVRIISARWATKREGELYRVHAGGKKSWPKFPS